MKKYYLVFLFMFLFNYLFNAPIHYRINAKLNIENKKLYGKEIITFQNIYNTELNDIYLHTFPNAFRKGSIIDKEMQERGDYSIAFANKKEIGYLNIKSIESSISIKDTINENEEFHIILKTPIKIGDTLVLEIEFEEKIPKFYLREGYKNNHFELTQWYPKVAMYDDKGWHHEGYHLIGEFYSEFADYDVMIELPINYLTGATGELVGPNGENERMKKLSSGPYNDSTYGVNKTVYYRAKNVTDFAFVADPKFLFERIMHNDIEINILKTRKNLKHWKSVGDYVIKAIDFYSEKIGKYPYKRITVVDGNITAGGGMEYPQLIIVKSTSSPISISLPGMKDKEILERIVAHETGHQWFYASLATDEYNEPFMDEGINSFYENEYMIANVHKDEKSKRGELYKNMFLSSIIYYANITYSMNTSCASFDNSLLYGSAIYSEGPLVMREIRTIMGEKVFDNFMKEYYNKYTFSHPRLKDYISLVYKFTNRQNADYIKRRLTENIVNDFKFKEVMIEGDTVKIMIDKGDFFPQLPISLFYKDTILNYLAPEGTGLQRFYIKGTKGLKNIVINKNRDVFEVKRLNNYWKNLPKFKILGTVPDFDHYQIFLGPYAWYDSRGGVIAGLWLEGREFINYDFLMGKNQWHAGINWQFKNSHPEYIFAYSTPLIAQRNYLKFYFNYTISNYIYTSQITLKKKFSGDFFFNVASSRYLIGKVTITYKDVSKVDSIYIDPINYEKGKMSTINFGIESKETFKYINYNITGNLQLGKNRCLSDFDILKGAVTMKSRIGGRKKILGVDLFAGAGNSDIPMNYRFDMSGDMMSYAFDGKHIKAYSGFSGKLSFLFPYIRPYISAGYLMHPTVNCGIYYSAGMFIDAKIASINIPIFYKSPDMSKFDYRILFIFKVMDIDIGSISL